MKIGYLNTNNKGGTPFVSFIENLGKLGVSPDILILSEIKYDNKREQNEFIEIRKEKFIIAMVSVYKSEKSEMSSEKILVLINLKSLYKIIFYNENDLNYKRRFAIEKNNKKIIFECIHWPSFFEHNPSSWISSYNHHCKEESSNSLADILIGDFNVNISERESNSLEGEWAEKLIISFEDRDRKIYGQTKNKDFYTFKNKEGNKKKNLDFVFSNIPCSIKYSNQLISDHKYMEIEI